MNASNGATAPSSVGTPEWLEEAPRTELVNYVRDLQLQVSKTSPVSQAFDMQASQSNVFSIYSLGIQQQGLLLYQ